MIHDLVFFSHSLRHHRSKITGSVLIGLFCLLIFAGQLWNNKDADIYSGFTEKYAIHSSILFNSAVNRASCDVASGHNNRKTPSAYLLDIESGKDLKVLEIPAKISGNLEQYCSELSPGANATVNELSALLLNDLGLRIFPDITVNQLGILYLGFAIFCYFLFGVGLFVIGLPVLFVLIAIFLGAFATNLAGVNYIATYYSLILPVTLGFFGIAILISQLMQKAGHIVFVFLSVVLAAAFVFALNLRTSHAPALIFALFTCLLFLWADAKRVGVSGYVRWARALCLIGSVVLMVGIWESQFSKPILESEGKPFAHHGVFHPLVISLGIPKGNPLAVKYGLEWSDALGWDKAREISPTVGYLGPGYEEALAQYYKNIILEDTGLLASLYFSRLNEAYQTVSSWAAYNYSLTAVKEYGEALGLAMYGFVSVLRMLASSFLFSGLLAFTVFSCVALYSLKKLGTKKSVHPVWLAVAAFVGLHLNLLLEWFMILPGMFLSHRQAIAWAFFASGLIILQILIENYSKFKTVWELGIKLSNDFRNARKKN